LLHFVRKDESVHGKRSDLVGIQDFPNVTRALAVFVARPAAVRGLGIPARS